MQGSEQFAIPEAEPQRLVGSHISRIRIVSVIGEGGMGCVYAGVDEKLGRRVAVKAIRPGGGFDREARARLIREARALAKIDHPNLCRVYDVLEHDGDDFLALELIEGRTLHDAVAAGLSFDAKIRIAIAIADVLAAAHRAGILHRDLKPENVMLTTAGAVKVLDFGLARFLDAAPDDRRPRRSRQWQAVAVPATPEDDHATWAFGAAAAHGDSSQTQAGMVVGTPLYMSPEQARGQELTPASDMFSFGLLLQYLFDGQEAYPADATSYEVMRMVAAGLTAPMGFRDKDLRTLVGSLKSLAPTDRPPAVIAHRRLVAISGRRTRRARIALAAALVAAVAGGATKYTIDLRQQRTRAVEARAAADDLIGFMIGDLRTRLDSVGRTDVLDAVATKSLAYFDTLEPEEISSADLQRNADTLMEIGSLRMTQGNTAEAAAAFQRALVLAGRAVDLDPRNLEALQMAGRAHSWLGMIHYGKGDTAAGTAEMEQYLEAAERLRRLSPPDSVFQKERAFAHSNLGSFAETRGDVDAALVHFEKAMTTLADAWRGNPKSLETRVDLATALNKIAWAEFKAGRIGRAREHFLEERRVLQTVLADDPKDETRRQRLAVNHYYVGDVSLAQGDVETALAEFRADAELQQRAVGHDPDNLTWLRGLVAAHRQIGEVLRERDAASALQSYETAARLWRPRYETRQTEIVPAMEMAAIETGFARVFLQQGKHARAAQHGESALAILRALKPSLDVKRWIVTTLVTLGQIDAAAGRPDAAMERWRDAEAVLGSPSPALRDPRLLDLRARILLLMGRTAEARPFLEKLDAMGYRHSELQSLRDMAAR